MKSWIALLILMLALTALRFDPEWGYALGIDEHSLVVATVPVEKRSNGLRGASVNFVVVDPAQPDRVVISTRGGGFLTTDHGEHWTPLGQYDQGYAWVDGLLVTSSSDGDLKVSNDEGRTWKKVEVDGHVRTVGQDSSGRAWMQQLNDRSYWLQSVSGELRIGESRGEEFPEFEPRTTIEFDGAALSAQLFPAPGGWWAATPRGPLFRSGEDGPWVDCTANLSRPAVAQLYKSSIEPRECLARGKGGRLWVSSDLGQEWERLALPPVSHAAYRPDGSIVVVGRDLSVSLVSPEASPVDLTPDVDLFLEPLSEMAEDLGRNFYPERFEIRHLGADAERIWLVGTDWPIYDPMRALHRGYLARIEPYRDVSTRLVLLVHTESQGWQSRPLSELESLESPTEEPCELAMSGLATSMLEVTLDGEPFPPGRFGAVMRAGWLSDGSTYALGDAEFQVNGVSDCRATTPARVWDFDQITGQTASVIFDFGDSVEILSPASDGIEWVRLTLSSAPIWKRTLHWLSFGPGFFLGWALLVGAGVYLAKRPSHSLEA